MDSIRSIIPSSQRGCCLRSVQDACPHHHHHRSFSRKGLLAFLTSRLYLVLYIEPPTSFSSSFRCRSVHSLQILSRALFSGDQGYYSTSSEACQEHHKFDPFKSHNPIHELYPNNHHSSQEREIYGTFYQVNSVQNPTTCHLSNLKSINLISLSS